MGEVQGRELGNWELSGEGEVREGLQEEVASWIQAFNWEMAMGGECV